MMRTRSVEFRDRTCPLSLPSTLSSIGKKTRRRQDGTDGDRDWIEEDRWTEVDVYGTDEDIDTDILVLEDQQWTALV